MQPFDFTTLTAICHSLKDDWLPARLEQVYQSDRFTIALALRTLKQRGWLTISWHPQAARICLGDAPPKVRDTFTFSEQLRAKLGRYALIDIQAIAPWERVLDLQFAHRPGENPLFHLYVEIMGNYSNVILTDANKQIITVAYQVTSSQSRVRTVETGQVYELPPPLTAKIPKLEEEQASWQERVSLIPDKIKGQLLKTYRGLSPALVHSMLQVANIEPDTSTHSLSNADWGRLFSQWQHWLNNLAIANFESGWTESGYTVMGWGITKPVADIHSLINLYYTQQLNRQTFQQLRHQLRQKLTNILRKLHTKADTFKQRLEQSADADSYRQQADLLMAHLHLYQGGMTSITLNDFTTGKPVKIKLNPEKNAVQNAQYLYKQHQKLKRARGAVEPLLTEVQTEINYLEQVEASLNQLSDLHNTEDLLILEDIREELIDQGYLVIQKKRERTTEKESLPHRYPSPSGFEVWVGRNNRQNDQLTFRIAGDYDLWFHTQEIAGSHVLLRLTPGAVAAEADLQFAANLAAYYSRGRESEQVGVVYTKPKYVYKPKGAKPGMIVYKREKLIWGCPQTLTLSPLNQIL